MEQELIAALRQRDPAAFADVFATYSDKIYRLAVSLLHDEQAADGVVQDTFLALIEHIHTFEERASLATWLYRVAYNHAQTRLRHQRPQVDLDEWADDNIALPEKMIDWSTLPELLLTGEEAKAQIMTAISTLSPSLRAVFILRDVEELSTEATAEALGIQPGAVKVRLHRARLALRETLAGYFEEIRGEEWTAKH
ncbi:MAG: sigma-70 family RNA polymerase sigma factor [Chloroflexi bacterium]|nr:sigma-70 family RNA polymerase sigma factor [Chloroflexota bacterium]